MQFFALGCGGLLSPANGDKSKICTVARQWRQEQNLHGLVSREASLLVPHGELSSETNTRAGESM